jgi:hypothetical protein
LQRKEIFWSRRFGHFSRWQISNFRWWEWQLVVLGLEATWNP